jgi:hypothetical protein
MPEDASSALEMREFEGALKASLSHTRNHSSNQTLGQSKESSLGSRTEERSGVNAQVCFCPVVGQQ